MFNGFLWTRWTSQNWQIPLTACVLYILMIFFLRNFMRDRKPIRLTPVVICWNFGLSLFSMVGMYYCVPHLLYGPQGVVRYGLYASVCPHPTTYGHGYVGFFVAAFIYSKLAELVDTFWLLIRKSPVIFLHW